MWDTIPNFYSKIGLHVKAMEAEAVTQSTIFTQLSETLAIPTQQATPSILATPSQPMETLLDQSQKSPRYCVICTPARKWHPTKYLMPLK